MNMHALADEGMHSGPDILVTSGDLPSEIEFGQTVAIDIETGGLDHKIHAIGAIQVFDCHSVYVIRPPYNKPGNLKRLLADQAIRKVFHHALFDLRFLRSRLDLIVTNAACTKIAAKIVSPGSKATSLRDLTQKYLGVSLDKSMQMSDWLGSLSDEQLTYAARDVIYLPRLLSALAEEASGLGRLSFLESSFRYIPTRVELDILGAGDVFVY